VKQDDNDFPEVSDGAYLLALAIVVVALATIIGILAYPIGPGR
jgi:hypothetical protein